MMSASLSKLKRSSRLWVAVICAILSFLYFPVLCLLMVSSGRMEFVGASPADIHLHLSEIFSRILGFRQVGFAVITILLAIFMGLESFAYLDDKRKLDFYESQPVYRGRRFRNIYLGSLLIWLVSYLVNLAISLLIAGATGAMTGTLVLESLLESVIMTGLFAAVYSITVLAKILTGRILVSLMMAAYFFAFEPLLRAILNFFAGRYLMTYVGQQTRMFSSPIAYWIRGLGTVYRIDAFENLREVALCFWGLRWGLVANLILAILAGGLAYLAYRKRGAEMAGCAVVFNWVRVLVKITGTSLCGLMVAVVLDQILLVRGSGINQLLYVLFVFLMTTLIATLTEALLSMNIKAMGHRPWEAAISVGLVLLVFLVFRFDLLGYDRSQPGPDRIRSCALYDERLLPRDDDILLNSSYGGSFFYGNQGDSGLREGDPSQVGGPAMALTNKEDLLAMVKAANAWAADHKDRLSSDAWTLRIKYRLKSGRVCLRKVHIPYDMKASLLDPITSSEEFKEASFPLPKPDSLLRRGNVGIYVTGNTESANIETQLNYGDFYQAYREDLKSYSYSMVLRDRILAEVTVHIYDKTGEREWVNTYPIYASYQKSLALLKEHGFDPNERLQADRIEKVIVIGSNRKGRENGIERSAEFYSQKEIQEILDRSESMRMESLWSRIHRISDDKVYSVRLIYREGGETDHKSNDRYLLRDRAPACVLRAMEQRDR